MHLKRLEVEAIKQIEDMRKILGVFIVLFVHGTSWVSAQCPGIVSPEPTCIRVLANGDVEVDFAISTMGGPTPLDIQEFELWHSTSCQTKTKVATIPVGAAWPTATFVHVGANANVQDACYHIVAICAGPPVTPLAPSKDIKAIRLDNTVSNDFEVELVWNYDLSSANLNTTVNRKWPATAPSWFNIANPAYVQNDMSYVDTVVACQATVAYQIKFTNPTYNCQSQSSVDTAFILDDTPPVGVRLDSVSTDPLSLRPQMGWSASSSKDTRGYVIYRHINGDCGNNEVVDSILGRTKVKTKDLTSTYNGIGPAQYSIRPYDECFNVTPFNGTCVKSMFVTPTLDVCKKSVRLDWNHYEDFESGTDVLYKIFVSIGGSNFVYVGSTTDPYYVHDDPFQNVILTYKVVAFENGGAGPFTATSNHVDVDAEFLKLPEYQYLRYMTVADRNYVETQLFTDIHSDAHSYVLKRSLDTSSVFSTVNVFYAPKRKIPADSVVTMNDRSALTDQFQYFYKVDIYDSCGAFMASSNFNSTIHLKVEANSTKRVNKLEWTNVYGWEGGTFAYHIYRFLDGNQLREPITKFPDSGRTTVFYDSLLLINDNITAGNPSQGEYCYYVVAEENEPTFKGVAPAYSNSNEVCVVQQPYLTIPNAFTPNGDGKNETFRPILVYHDSSSYEFYVVNRWGETIYKTNSVAASWDGTNNGKPVPPGVYVYSVRYKASTGEQFEKQGTIAVIR
ncbi:MAG TPA: hypothetical protein DCX54_09340 [Flavobacteriales bacterium]|nr:hypothetical protein [Flavobacteriales bacterium]